MKNSLRKICRIEIFKQYSMSLEQLFNQRSRFLRRMIMVHEYGRRLLWCVTFLKHISRRRRWIINDHSRFSSITNPSATCRVSLQLQSQKVAPDRIPTHRVGLECLMWRRIPAHRVGLECILWRRFSTHRIGLECLMWRRFSTYRVGLECLMWRCIPTYRVGLECIVWRHITTHRVGLECLMWRCIPTYMYRVGLECLMWRCIPTYMYRVSLECILWRLLVYVLTYFVKF